MAKRRQLAKRLSQGGQIMSEYAMMLVVFAAISVILLLVLASFTDYGLRLIILVALHNA